MKKIAKYKVEEVRDKLACPMCKKIVTIEQTRLSQINDWLIMYYNWADSNLFARAKNGTFNDWACRYCELKGHAVFPNYSKQHYGYGGPIYYYLDKNYNCSTCKKEFTFKATEQKYWYEDMNFNHSAYPKNCLNCRKKIRQPKQLNKKLGDLLNLNLKSPEVLEEIASLYKQLGIDDKAAVFYARARNTKK